MNDISYKISPSLALEAARRIDKLNQKKPVKREKKDRNKTITLFLSNINDIERCLSTKTYFRSTFVNGKKHCCKKILEKLKKINLNEMMVPKIHTGSYLLCRTVSVAFTVIGISTIIEDVNGDVEELVLYNLQSNLHDDPNNIVPIGSILLIKEPYLTFTCESMNAVIRCDSPSDVLFIDESDEILNDLSWFKPINETFEEIKEKGNEYYKQHEYEKSIKFYTRAMKIQKNPVIYLNRSAAYLQLERYYEAYNDAQLAYKCDLNKEKALFRMGKAAYGMQKWKKAVQHFTAMINMYPNRIEAADELIKSKKRMEESLSGKYDLNMLYEDAYVKKIRHLDIAEYVGSVEIRDTFDGNKGLFATENIKKGTLLLVSKAFSICYDDDLDINIKSVNLINNYVDYQSNAINYIQTIKTLQRNPNRANDLYSLYAGHLNRAYKIPTGVIDIERIEQICTFNSFIEDDLNKIGIVKGDCEISQFSLNTGLWILPSYMNHSCTANCFRTYYADVMMVYAIDDIKKDQELLCSYMDSTMSYQNKLAVMKYYDFICNCCLCKEDRQDYNYALKEELSEDFSLRLNFLLLFNYTSLLHIILAAEFYDTMNELCENRSKFKLQMIIPMHFMAKICFFSSEFIEAVAWLKKIIDLIVSMNIMSEKLAYYYIRVSHCYMKCQLIKLSKDYLNKAIEANIIRMGGDIKLFKDVYKNILQKANLYSLI